ncbi:uncharacterized protein LOC143284528 [Babylonia areolata]|uniref:uncharacterized protein LOC143284528 n=1 Tax=Babylonia areolata TaxID=304850 RepID=UPI003FD06B11
MTTEEKRLFIGGLVKGVTEEELVEKFSRFGQVSNVEIKTRATDTDSKTFAYLNLTAEDKAFKKCFTSYNNTKWKGGQLKLQFAKESFLSKLKKEQAEAKLSQEKNKNKPPPVHKSPALETDKKAVPGTPMDDKGTWVMGKYSRVLPVLHLRKPGSRKAVTVDPSKMTHCIKKLKTDDYDPEEHCDLTWQLEENTSDINKRRQGQFPAQEPPQHPATPQQQTSLFCRLQGLASEQHVSDTEMEVVPVGKLQTVSKTPAPSAYDSDDSAGSADTDEIVLKASGKKRTAANLNATAETSLKKKNLLKSSVRGDDSAGHNTPSSKPPKTPNSTRTKKEPLLKNGEQEVKDAKTEEKQKPQFQFAKTPKLKGRALKKSAKLNHSKTASVGNMLAEDASETDSEEAEIEGPTSSSQRKSSNKTPEFKGLGMLSGDSDSEDDVPSAQSPETGSRKSASKAPEFKADNKLELKASKTPDSKANKTPESKSKKTPDLKANKTLANKTPDLKANKTPDLKTNKTSDSKANKTPKSKADKTPEFKGLGVLSSDNEDAMPPARSPETGRSKTKGSNLVTDPSSPVMSASRKRSKPSSSDDSDLDDNDFEKVGKKLAAQALRQKGRGQNSAGKEPQGSVPGTSAALSAKTNVARKRKTCQDEEGQLSSNMQRSHQAYSKFQQEKKKKENLITKTLREGTGSTRIKFSDSEAEDEPANMKPAKMSLFDDSGTDSDNDSEVDFSIRPQFEGSKGKKLFELQSKIMDKRFRFDERFESEDEDEETMEVEEDEPKHDSDDEMAKEKRQNLEILEKVLGYKPRERKRLVYEDMSKRRYNPDSADNHHVLVVKPKRKKLDSSGLDMMKADHSGQQKSIKPDVSADRTEGEDVPDHNVSDSDAQSGTESSEHEDGGESGSEHSEQDAEADSDSENSEQDVEAESDSENSEQVAEEESDSENSEQVAEEESDSENSKQVAKKESDSENSEQDVEAESDSENSEQVAEEESDSENSEQVAEEESDSENSEQDAEEGSSSEDAEGDLDKESSDKTVTLSPTEGENLKNLFGGGSSFSFFGAPETEVESETVTFSKQMDVDKDEDDEEEEEEEMPQLKESRFPETDRVKPPDQQQPSFMVARDDPRLTAAVRFFKRPHPEEFEELNERWSEERQKIMQLVRERHKRACRKERQMKQGIKSRPFVKTKTQKFGKKRNKQY